MKKTVSSILLFFSMIVLHGQHLSENHVFSLPFKKSGKESVKMYVINVYATAEIIKQDLDNLESNNLRSHILGNEVAKRVYLFEKYYAYKSEAAPGSFSGRKLVDKPVIYNNIYKLERHYKKKARNSQEEIPYYAGEFAVFLDYALLMSHADTEEFEKALMDAKSLDDVKLLFTQVVFK